MLILILVLQVLVLAIFYELANQLNQIKRRVLLWVVISTAFISLTWTVWSILSKPRCDCDSEPGCVIFACNDCPAILGGLGPAILGGLGFGINWSRLNMYLLLLTLLQQDIVPTHWPTHPTPPHPPPPTLHPLFLKPSCLPDSLYAHLASEKR